MVVSMGMGGGIFQLGEQYEKVLHSTSAHLRSDAWVHTRPPLLNSCVNLGRLRYALVYPSVKWI